jgi:hypothetical protein
MSDDINAAQTARRAAARLAADINPGLPEQVERALAEDPLERSPERVVDPISLGALIVSIASFGWTVYRDLKRDREAARDDQAARAKRLATRLQEKGTDAIRVPEGIASEQRSRIIDVVAEEIVAAEASSRP